MLWRQKMVAVRFPGGGGGHAVVTGWQWSRSPDKRPLDPWGLRIQIYLGDAFSDRFSVSGKLEYYVFSKNRPCWSHSSN